jgi:hypothetical protein
MNLHAQTLLSHPIKALLSACFQNVTDWNLLIGSKEFTSTVPIITTEQSLSFRDLLYSTSVLFSNYPSPVRMLSCILHTCVSLASKAQISSNNVHKILIFLCQMGECDAHITKRIGREVPVSCFKTLSYHTGGTEEKHEWKLCLPVPTLS